MEITLPDGSRIVFAWVRPNVLHLELWQRGHLGKDVLLLRSSTLVEGRELRQLKTMLLKGEQEPEIPLPPNAA